MNMSLRLTVLLLTGVTLLILFAPSSGSLGLFREEAQAATYSSPEWWPLRGSNKVGCTRNSPGSVCEGNYHSWWAIDVEGPTGQNVYASGSGVASIYSNIAGCSGYGRAVVVDHGTHGKSLYGHLSSINISNGQQVSAGTVIGKVGSTGSTSLCSYSHLHYEETSGSFGGGARDPGQLKACIGSRLTSYPSEWGRSSWNGLPGHTYTARSDGTSCAPSGSNPTGFFDSASTPEAGKLRVRGWAFDKDSTGTSLTIHIYVGGKAGTGAEGHSIGAANVSRPDVHRVHKAGNNHGFDKTFETGKTGSKEVCAYALNVKGGSNSFLGCKKVNIESPHPYGRLDQAISPRPGIVLVRGWMFDKSVKTSPISYHVYVGGKAGSGAEGHNGFPKADLLRSDVGKAFPGVGNNHGYASLLETKRLGKQEVCVYGLDVGVGDNALIGCKSVTIADPSPRGHFDVLDSPAAGRVRVRGWTVDPNDPTAPTAVHVYVGGKAGSSAAGHNIGFAALSRPDVGRVHADYGSNHGFGTTLPTNLFGPTEVCAYVINIGPGINKLLDCKSVMVMIDVVPPTIRAKSEIRKKIVTKKKRALISFNFGASEDFVSFRCQLDSRKWFACKPGVKIRVKPKRHWRQHRFAVLGTDYAGNLAEVGPVWNWAIKRK